MDYYLIVIFIVSFLFLILYRNFLSANAYEFYQNLLPEIFGLFVTYNLIEYGITKKKNRENQRRLTNLYQQIKSELCRIRLNLKYIVDNIESIDDIFYRWAKENKNSVKITYPLLIAGNDLFSEYFYATLFRVIRDVEQSMDHIIDHYQKTELNIFKSNINTYKLRHDELANFIMYCEYEKNPEKIELYQDQSEK